MDVIGDMVNMLKNASMAGKDAVLVQHSALKQSIAECLKKAGYIVEIEEKTHKGHKALLLLLEKGETKADIRGVRRISKPSRRMYGKVGDFKKYLTGRGVLVLSTPKGILTHLDARKELVGGELLFTIW
ncbi:30S ribosomal protein S8 [Candidatus Nomurabacteria bacterium]|nr:30S ribosomal protein S8 [Candidatus Nomurabacteria bacterium]MCB9820748.1 30S ribosomal protein S8 [Candidatus Nomurabacteria bacterium]